MGRQTPDHTDPSDDLAASTADGLIRDADAIARKARLSLRRARFRDPKDAVAALKLSGEMRRLGLELRRKSAPQRTLAEYYAELDVILRAVRDTVPESQWRAIADRIDFYRGVPPSASDSDGTIEEIEREHEEMRGDDRDG